MTDEPLAVCDDCGDALAYPGNRLDGSTYCDGCYDAWTSLLP